MNAFGRLSTRTRLVERTMVHEARVAVVTVDEALRGDGLAGPADAYHLMGSLGLVRRTLQRSLSELSTWLREVGASRRLTVVDGPFVDDPEAAVRVASQALVEASRACREVFGALERAHIATALVGAEQGRCHCPGVARSGADRGSESGLPEAILETGGVFDPTPRRACSCRGRTQWRLTRVRPSVATQRGAQAPDLVAKIRLL